MQTQESCQELMAFLEIEPTTLPDWVVEMFTLPGDENESAEWVDEMFAIFDEEG